MLYPVALGAPSPVVPDSSARYWSAPRVLGKTVLARTAIEEGVRWRVGCFPPISQRCERPLRW